MHRTLEIISFDGNIWNIKNLFQKISDQVGAEKNFVTSFQTQKTFEMEFLSKTFLTLKKIFRQKKMSQKLLIPKIFEYTSGVKKKLFFFFFQQNVKWVKNVIFFLMMLEKGKKNNDLFSTDFARNFFCFVFRDFFFNIFYVSGCHLVYIYSEKKKKADFDPRGSGPFR